MGVPVHIRLRESDLLCDYFAVLDAVIDDIATVLNRAEGAIPQHMAVRLAIADKAQPYCGEAGPVRHGRCAPVDSII